jgi:hypothetical protein
VIGQVLRQARQQINILEASGARGPGHEAFGDQAVRAAGKLRSEDDVSQLVSVGLPIGRRPDVRVPLGNIRPTADGVAPERKELEPNTARRLQPHILLPHQHADRPATEAISTEALHPWEHSNGLVDLSPRSPKLISSEDFWSQS